MQLLDLPEDILAALRRRSTQDDCRMARGGTPWAPKWALIRTRRCMLAETCRSQAADELLSRRR